MIIPSISYLEVFHYKEREWVWEVVTGGFLFRVLRGKGSGVVLMVSVREPAGPRGFSDTLCGHTPWRFCQQLRNINSPAPPQISAKLVQPHHSPQKCQVTASNHLCCRGDLTVHLRTDGDLVIHHIWATNITRFLTHNVNSLRTAAHRGNNPRCVIAASVGKARY